MAAPSILHDLIRAGVEFETDGERIRWRNSGGRVTPEVIAALQAHKAEAVAYLMAAPANSTGQVIPWPGRSYSPEAIRQGVAAAFVDYAATDDPHDPRAWA